MVAFYWWLLVYGERKLWRVRPCGPGPRAAAPPACCTACAVAMGSGFTEDFPFTSKSSVLNSFFWVFDGLAFGWFLCFLFFSISSALVITSFKASSIWSRLGSNGGWQASPRD